MNESGLDARREFARAHNYYDFARAALGTLALLVAFGGGGEGPLGHLAGTQARDPLLVQAAILGVAVLVQTISWPRGRMTLAAPVFFLAGATIAFHLPVAGVCAFAMAWIMSPVVPNAQGFLVVQTVVLCVLGAVLHGLNLATMISVGLCFLPVFLSLLARRPLLVLSRHALNGRSGVQA
ncbi:hypothetical protein DB354_12620 [Opitutus sp. ER46]|nr:hypothetical protein DB354_12620 [Opitutus sp. ER46]